MSEYFSKPESSGGRVKVEWDLSNSKNATGVVYQNFSKKSWFSKLKNSNVDKSDIDKLKNVWTSLSNLKSKVDKLDVDKLVPVYVDLNKVSDAVKNDVVKKDV